MIATYKTDVAAWSQEQARLLRARRFAELDIEHIAEEIEDVGKSEQRELESRLEILLLHLLKWQFQAGLQSRSWRLTILEQRRRIGKLLRRVPSLQSGLQETLADVYDDARFSAMAETGLDIEMFPDSVPWMADQVLDYQYFPEA